MDEKRRYYRIKDGKIQVLYKLSTSLNEHIVPIIDISGGGMRLPIKEKIAPGTILELSLSLPGEQLPFLGVAKVIWQDATPSVSGGKKFYETGIEFMRLGIQNRKLLVRYINSHLNNR